LGREQEYRAGVRSHAPLSQRACVPDPLTYSACHAAPFDSAHRPQPSFAPIVLGFHDACWRSAPYVPRAKHHLLDGAWVDLPSVGGDVCRKLAARPSASEECRHRDAIAPLRTRTSITWPRWSTASEAGGFVA
jgi:hypothetical protein